MPRRQNLLTFEIVGEEHNVRAKKKKVVEPPKVRAASTPPALIPRACACMCVPTCLYVRVCVYQRACLSPPPPTPPPLRDATPAHCQPFILKQSVFAPRCVESESKAFYDTSRIRNRVFLLAWSRVVAKERVQRMITREAGGDASVIAQVHSRRASGVECRAALLTHLRRPLARDVHS